MWGPNKVGFDASISDSKVWRTEADSPFYIVRLCVFPCRRVLRLMSISNIFYIAHCLNWSCIIYIGILIQVQQINVSLEMDPQLRQLIISSWMLHNKSREFIRAQKSQVRRKRGLGKIVIIISIWNLINIIIILFIGGGWAIEKRLKLLSNRNCLIYIKIILMLSNRYFSSAQGYVCKSTPLLELMYNGP